LEGVGRGVFDTRWLQQRKYIMDVVLNFFAVRPVFTLYGLRVLWGAYLIDQALPFVAVLSNQNLTTASITPLVALLLRACLNIVIFRLLIEVAASLLLGRPSSVH
jgi:hypothetical protein